ncbi:MAG: methylated-DNA--[protein]-cysteine S-methyltransferase [Candidatus Aminicenantes bacterium]|nr:methylated-DNA--[protein]-cysteine S-methyltransferase [Candidatus Aminicenantes bacterium]
MFLSKAQKPVEQAIRENYPDAQQLSSPAIVELSGQVQRFLEGQDVVFDLEMIALEVCGEFQQQVLLAEYAIPRGWVSTYGRIARHIGVTGGSRAVGRALAENPFPIIIPCHRAVRADGEIGGYQGGSDMKRTLLAMEGIAFAGKGKVLMERVHY